MSNLIEVRVPDIGDSTDVEVIEILVSVGDVVAVEDSLITLESDKASMEIPSNAAGEVKEIKLAVGDKANEGDLVLMLAVATAADAATAAASATVEPDIVVAPAPPTPSMSPAADIHVTVPDIGDSTDVEVIELLVAVGDTVAVEDALITLESDKASMDIPSPAAGVVKSIALNLGDKVNPGDLVLALEGSAAPASRPAALAAPSTATTPAAAAEATPAAAPAAAKASPVSSPTAGLPGAKFHASPAIRKYARELGTDLSNVRGSGRKGRIVKEDLKAYIKSVMQGVGTPGGVASGTAGGAGIPAIPEIDFSNFGEIERVEMGRIHKLSAANLHRAWLNLPMVTHHDEADITDLEDFRKSLKADAEKAGVRVTGLVFHMKVLAACLKSFPKFNSSITSDGEALIFKKYFNIGIAVDTPNGLVVPVFKDVDKKSIYELSAEIMDISKRAREKKLKGTEMQGACMTISSLGGIGGTAFTPIVNAPEAAILGITRARMQPVWNGKEFLPRLMCPIDMSYDHRIIDGADAARFVAHYCQLIGDVRRVLL